MEQTSSRRRVRDGVMLMLGAAGVLMLLLAVVSLSSFMIEQEQAFVYLGPSFICIGTAFLILIDRIRSRGVRILSQSVIAALVFAPGFVYGHGGIMPAPAWWMALSPELAGLAIASFCGTAAVASLVFYTIAVNRKD